MVIQGQVPLHVVVVDGMQTGIVCAGVLH